MAFESLGPEPLASGPLTHLGNVKSFIYTPTVVIKDHFSKQSPLRAIDLSVVSQVSAEIKMELEEINQYNLSLFLMAQLGATSHLTGLTDTGKQGTLTFTGTNSIGSKITFSGYVQIQPGGDLAVLQDNDDFQFLPVNAKVLLNAGGYGVWTVGGVVSPSTINYSIAQGTVDFQQVTG